jgi:hypothetical protein
VTLEEIKSKLKGKLFVSEMSTLVLNGDLTLEGNIKVDGVLKLSGNGIYKDITVEDKNYD